MEASLIYRGRTMKQALVTGTANETDDAVLDLALDVARETRSSLFGWQVIRTDGTGVYDDPDDRDYGIERAVVTLHTD